MNKHIILIISIFFCASFVNADSNRGITSSSSSLVNTSLALNRKVLRNGNIRFIFRLDVTHLTDNASCIHFLELIPVTQKGRQLEEIIFKKVANTISSSIVRWRDNVRPTKRTKNRQAEIHVRVSSSCTEGDTTETINSNVASRYSCTSELNGISPKRQARKLRNARVRSRAS